MTEPSPRPDPRAQAARPAPSSGRVEREAQRIVEASARCRDLLARSSDPQAVLLSALEAVVPSIAEWGVLVTRSVEGAPGLRQALHGDEACCELLEQLQIFPQLRGAPPKGPRLLAVTGDEALSALGSPSELAVLRELKPQVVALVPLAACREGLLVLGAGSGHTLGADDLPLLALLADQIAVALHGARAADRAAAGQAELAEELGGLVHDLRNHVHALTLCAHLLAGDGLDDAERRGQLESLDRVLRLMNERLTAALGDDGEPA